MSKTKTISLSINKGKQSVEYYEILIIESYKLRIKIKSDSYDFQSYAFIELWNGQEWKEVHKIHYASMKTPYGLSSNQHNQGEKTSQQIFENNESYFNSDRLELLKIAKSIIF